MAYSDYLDSVIATLFKADADYTFNLKTVDQHLSAEGVEFELSGADILEEVYNKLNTIMSEKDINAGLITEDREVTLLGVTYLMLTLKDHINIKDANDLKTLEQHRLLFIRELLIKSREVVQLAIQRRKTIEEQKAYISTLENDKQQLEAQTPAVLTDKSEDRFDLALVSDDSDDWLDDI